MAHLEVHTPEGVRRVPLGAQGVTLGRSAKNTVALDDALASRAHCSVQRTEQGWLLEDLDSRNGTLMGGLRVVKVVLRPGAEFMVGGTRVVFVDEAAARAKAPGGAAEARGARRESRAAPPREVAGALVTTGDAVAGADDDPDDVLGGMFRVEGDGEPEMRGGNFGVTSLESLSRVGQDPGFELEDVSLVNARGQTVHAAEDRGAKQEAVETLRVLRLILYGCMRSGASDIHIEPKRHDGLIRLRIDGAMVEVTTVDAAELKRLNSLIKVLCDIDFTKKAAVQEGHFSVRVPGGGGMAGRQIDYRISFTPSMFGQKLVIRVLDPANAPQRLRDLNLPDFMYSAIKTMSRQSTGMLLTCGPTGSGKTTTLYATLREIDASLRNVITIEDPVEYEVAGVTQMPVDAESGHTFASLLRSVLRQDPDVVVLGEIRDAETAVAAMQAATTGHLVLSTVHAKDTIGTIFRLLDLGVEPYLVASTLNHVLAQRLVRKLCEACKVKKTPTPQQQMKLGKSVEGVRQVYVPAGCPKCFNTGFSGRRGLYELLTVTDAMRDVILHSPNMGKIKQAIEMTVFQSLREAGMQLVLKGETSMEEIERVVGME
jgi:general secretion pathway protein E